MNRYKNKKTLFFHKCQTGEVSIDHESIVLNGKLMLSMDFLKLPLYAKIIVLDTIHLLKFRTNNPINERPIYIPFPNNMKEGCEQVIYSLKQHQNSENLIFDKKFDNYTKYY